MKIIHTADIHLGSKMDSTFDKTISDERKRALRNSFNRLVEYANENDVSIILLSGDVFDSDAPFKKDKDFFYNVIRNNPKIDFLYLKGNHDQNEVFSESLPENLRSFSSDEWTYYRYGNLVISGIEIAPTNISSYYSSLNLNPEDLNIVMLHGQITDGNTGGDINMKRLRNKNIDYLALGHIHKPSEGTLDERGKYRYPGCLEPRGFDEPGEHGFVLLDIQDNKIVDEFIPFSERQVHKIELDISNCENEYEVYQHVKSKVDFVFRDIYQLILTGEVEFDTDDLTAELKKQLEGSCHFIDIKNKTQAKIDIDTYKNELSLRGEFVRSVYSDASLDENQKQKIINLGLKALDGKEFNL